jgi:hypothetical protein
VAADETHFAASELTPYTPSVRNRSTITSMIRLHARMVCKGWRPSFCVRVQGLGDKGVDGSRYLHARRDYLGRNGGGRIPCALWGPFHLVFTRST